MDCGRAFQSTAEANARDRPPYDVRLNTGFVNDDNDDDEDLYSAFIRRAQSALQHFLGDFARLLFRRKLQPRSLQSYLNE